MPPGTTGKRWRSTPPTSTPASRALQATTTSRATPCDARRALGRAPERRQHRAGGDEQRAERAVHPPPVVFRPEHRQYARRERRVAAHHHRVGEHERRTADRVL